MVITDPGYIKSYNTVSHLVYLFPYIDTFRHVWERSILKILRERELPAFSPFPTMFSTLSQTELIIHVTFILSSANAFSVDKVKFLSSGNRLTSPHSSVVRVLDLKTRGCGFDSWAGQPNNYSLSFG